MKRISTTITLLISCGFFGIASCNGPLDPPVRDNPKDPVSPYWNGIRPQIQSVSLTPNGSVLITFVSGSKYAVSFRIERRIALTGSYTLVGTIAGSALTNSFYDTSNIPRGYT